MILGIWAIHSNNLNGGIVPDVVRKTDYPIPALHVEKDATPLHVDLDLCRMVAGVAVAAQLILHTLERAAAGLRKGLHLQSIPPLNRQTRVRLRLRVLQNRAAVPNSMRSKRIKNYWIAERSRRKIMIRKKRRFWAYSIRKHWTERVSK